MDIDRTSYPQTIYPVGHGYDLRPRNVVPTGIIIHTTNGNSGSTLAGEARYLQNSSGVSTHYLVGKGGEIIEFLAPGPYRAWHAGQTPAKWTNADTIGIENHFALGDTWTPAQRTALTELVQQLMADFAIPASQVTTHRAVALPSGRKIDPSGWTDSEFNQWRATLVPANGLSPAWRLTLMNAPRATQAQVWVQFANRPGDPYTEHDLREVIFPAYFAQATAVGLDPVIAICQSAYETGRWTSFWSQRPQRNPAGIAVTGQWWDAQPANEPAAYNPNRGRWERGVSFASWADDAIPQHLGRLLAFALPQGAGTAAQRALIDRALSLRPFPAQARGSAVVLAALGRVHNPSGIGWASPGTDYGDKLAALVTATVAR